jgi:hypothetical protein
MQPFTHITLTGFELSINDTVAVLNLTAFEVGILLEVPMLLALLELVLELRAQTQERLAMLIKGRFAGFVEAGWQ